MAGQELMDEVTDEMKTEEEAKLQEKAAVSAETVLVQGNTCSHQQLISAKYCDGSLSA